MKKKLLTIFAMILCVCFCFAGCNLFPENKIAKAEQKVVDGETTLTREEFIKGYNNYYETFYNNANGDSDQAIEDLIEYLVAKKVYLSDAEKLINEGKIILTNTEKNYLWNSTLSALISNIETFEEDVKEEIINETDDNDDDDDEKEQETQFVYTEYEPEAKVVFNNETNEYEIVLIKQVLIVKTEDGKEVYEYVSEEEAAGYDDSILQIYTIQYVLDKIQKDKLFSEKSTLTDEETEQKIITQEAIRRYIVQLRDNEEGKTNDNGELLSNDNNETVLKREIERIYGVLYENLLINKLYEYKSSSIEVKEEDVLNLYLSKVKESYDRYYGDTFTFITELVKTVGSAKLWGSYMEESNCVEDVFYIPSTTSNFFYVTHIVVNLTESQIQAINDLKDMCEESGKDDTYYQTEFYKIVPKIDDTTINAVINLLIKLEDENDTDVTEENYETKLLEIIGSKLLMVDERDEEGYVTTEVKTIQEMIASLYKDLDEIYIKYYGENGTPITLNGHVYTPSEDGLIIAEQNGTNNALVLEQLEVDYQNERADKFNEYIYKYSDDTGTIQIQKTYFGDTNENWYLYPIADVKTKTGGTDENPTYDSSFSEEFLETARALNTSAVITGVQTCLMENWSDDGELQSQSTAYSTMMYAGKITNLFECFDDEKFDLQDVLDEENTKGFAKYHSLLTMNQYRLGLTMNKTMFDLIFEEYYDTMYNEQISVYEDEVKDSLNIKINKGVISDIIG